MLLLFSDNAQKLFSFFPITYGNPENSNFTVPSGIMDSTFTQYINTLDVHYQNLQNVLFSSSGSNSNQLIYTGFGLDDLQRVHTSLRGSFQNLQMLSISLYLNDPIQSKVQIENKITSELTASMLYLGQFHDSVQETLKIMSSFAYSDPIQSKVQIENKITSELTANMIYLGQFHDSVQETLKVLSSFAYSDPIQSKVQIENKITSELTASMLYLGQFHDSVQETLKVLSSFAYSDTLQARQAIQNSLNDELLSFLKIIETVSASVDGMALLRNSFAEEKLQDIQKIVNSLEFVDTVQQFQRIFQIIGDPSDFGSSIEATTWNIFIDGNSVKNKLKNGLISFSEDSVHNSIKLNFSGEAVFDLCDTKTNYGLSRIEIQINSRILYFLIEERSGTEKEFEIWGRSLTALEDLPFKTEEAFILDKDKDAETLAMELAGSRVLDWECFNWVVPKGFQFIGPPVEGLQILANSIGAVLRSQDDGSFLVRKKYPVRPINMATAVPTVDYDRFSTMIELSFFETAGKFYNNLPINGYSLETEKPILQVLSEDNTFVQGDTAFVRCYYGDRIVSVDDIFLTAGIVSNLGFFPDNNIEEFLVFKDGIAETSKYISTVNSFDWVGLDGGSVSWETNSSRLLISEKTDRILKINYNSKYQYFSIHSHFVEMLNVVFSHHSNKDVSITLQIGAGDVVAPLLIENLLTSEAAAIEKGTSWFDDNIYDHIVLRIKAPYRENAIDGNTSHIANERIRVTGNAKINYANIVFEGIKIYNDLEVSLWPKI